jgi:hypothetical protein
MNRRKTLITLTLTLLSILAVICVGIFWRPLAFAFATSRMDREEQRELLYNVNHEVLAAELRKFATEERWSRQGSGSEPTLVNANDPRLPAALRVLHSSGTSIYDDRIEYDCGGPFLGFGIAVFREGNPGYGTKKLGDGIWFYAEDGRVPSR